MLTEDYWAVYWDITREVRRRFIEEGFTTPLQLSEVLTRASEHGLDLELHEDAVKFLIKNGFNIDYGARPLRRAIERYIEDPLAEEVLRLGDEGQRSIKVTVDDLDKAEKLTFHFEEPAPEEPEPVEAGSTSD